MHTGSVVLFVLHLVASLYMTGVIWFVQIVHYPLLNKLNENEFAQLHALHSQKTTYVVLPAMLLELGTAIWLLFYPFPNLFTVIILLILTAAPFLTTFIIQVPLHKKLSLSREEQKLSKLIHTNWIRTWMWTFKGIYLFTLIWILL